jgi:hypothetical protein
MNPHCLDNRLTGGGKSVSLTHRPRSILQIHFSISGSATDFVRDWVSNWQQSGVGFCLQYLLTVDSGIAVVDWLCVPEPSPCFRVLTCAVLIGLLLKALVPGCRFQLWVRRLRASIYTRVYCTPPPRRRRHNNLCGRYSGASSAFFPRMKPPRMW